MNATTMFRTIEDVVRSDLPDNAEVWRTDGYFAYLVGSADELAEVHGDAEISYVGQLGDLRAEREGLDRAIVLSIAGLEVDGSFSQELEELLGDDRFAFMDNGDVCDGAYIAVIGDRISPETARRIVEAGFGHYVWVRVASSRELAREYAETHLTQGWAYYGSLDEYLIIVRG